MNKSVVVAAGALLLAIGAAGGYWFASRAAHDAQPSRAHEGHVATEAEVKKIDPKTGRPVLYWHDPMVPGQRFDKPGRSPFMDMDLVPVYADEAGQSGTVTIDPRLQQNLGLRTAEVTRGSLAPKLEAVGSVAFNERAVAQVAARATGFIEKLYVRAPLDPVRAGQPLAEILAPDWVAAQEEYLMLLRTSAPGAEAMRQAGRQRLTVLGMPEDLIRAVERDGKTHARVTLTAPISGVVSELGAREGMTVMMGMSLFRINGLATVWINADVPEAQAASVKPGNTVDVRVAAHPAERFHGQVAALLPQVDAATRTLKVRIELANPKGLLTPGMFAAVDFSPAAKREALLVPSEAVIHTGKRDLVILAQEGGKFRPVEVAVGTEAGGMTEIREGLEAGQKVVVSAQFLIDSEASLKATANRMGETSAAPPGTMHRGEGVLESIDRSELMLSHEPIASLNWGPMTMGFKAPAQGLPAGLKAGERVAFEFFQNAKGEFELASIARIAPEAKGAAR